MKRVTLVFASRRGQTRAVAAYLRNRLEGLGHRVHTIDLSTAAARKGADRAGPADAYLIGGAIHGGRMPRAVIRWIRRHRGEMQGGYSGLFTVSLNAADPKAAARAVDDAFVRRAIDDGGWVPNFTASLIGALHFTRYGWFLRRTMRRISEKAGGPTDTYRDHALTDWNAVNDFGTAFANRDPASSFATARRFPDQRTIDEAMPQFEQSWAFAKMVRNNPQATWHALETLDWRDMRLARVLGAIRGLGRGESVTPQETLFAAAENFGSVELARRPPCESTSALVGCFWRLGFGIRRLRADAFAGFNEPGYVKVVTGIVVEPAPTGSQTRVRCTLRIHSTSAAARRKFQVYWVLLGPVIRLYMHSMIGAVCKGAERAARADPALVSQRSKQWARIAQWVRGQHWPSQSAHNG